MNSPSWRQDFWTASYFLKLVHRISRGYLPLIITAALFKAMTPFLNIVMPKFILDELMGRQRVEIFIALVAVIAAGNGLLNLINRFMTMRVELANIALINGFELHLGRHIMDMDFESLEDPEVLNQKDRALFAVNNQGALGRMISSLIGLVQVGITLVGLVAIVSTLSPWLVVLILVIVALNAYVFKRSQRYQFRMNNELIPINRKFTYYLNLINDVSMAKDVRIYNLCPYILAKISDYIQTALNTTGRLFGKTAKYEGFSGIILQIQMLIIYGYMVWRVLAGAIGIGDFTMYISAANNFSTSVSRLITQIVEFRQMCQYLELYLQFEQIPARSQSGERRVHGADHVTIEFRHVYFRYPRSETYALSDICLTIRDGETLSVVGPNGAGKTTFIKLLCRMYEPEKGEILVNGVNVKEYRYEDYMDLLSIVFQDYKLFSFTVAENLAFQSAPDGKRLEDALRQAGVWDAVQRLKKGADTSLYKNFDKEGTELSGGQAQKLAIARAIYKDAPIVILDEPTAALDPYAEFEIYSRFNEMVQNKTAVYISHRLSSCKFCDHIAVFDGGRLVEYGAHSQLEKQAGVYARMFQAQAQYYV